MKIRFKNFVLVLFFLFPGCTKKNKEKNIYKPGSSTKNSKVYKLKAEGIECKLCASLSVKALESLSETAKAEFICLDKDFKNYFINLFLKNTAKNPNIKNLQSSLKKEGFEFCYISGDFVGEYSKDFDKFKLTQSNEEFKIAASSITNKKDTIKQVNINAELKLDKTGKFMFKV